MASSKKKTSLSQTLRRLQADGEALPWTQRRELATGLAAILATGDDTKTALELVKLLVGDPQPEVRKEAAELIYYLPEKEFTKLAAQLSSDTSFFVQKAIERVLDRRRKGARASQRSRRNRTQVQAQLGSIEKFHGKLAADRARKLADKQFDVLVGETVHDIRNILSPLKGSVSTMISHFDGGKHDIKACRENLVKMSERLEYLERFIDDMRQYSQACTAPKHRERIADVIHEAKSLAQDTMKVQGRDINTVVFEITVPENITAEIARHQIVIALVHLIRNAYESFEMLKDKSRVNRIDVNARVHEKERVILTVRDNGPGIHEADLREYLQFNPGHSTKKSYGTGFGLPTAHRCAEAHNGTLTIESKLGEGSTMTITIPVDAEDEEA